jgi:cytosine/adenosine deaminase-related metal-dependent hydrolase
MSSFSATPDSEELFVKGAGLPGKARESRWDICCKNGFITSIDEVKVVSQSPNGHFLIPSLCHPHIHLDKCFLLSHPKYADLEIQKGDFAEAMSLTSLSTCHISILYLILYPMSQVKQSLDLNTMISWREVGL